MRTRTRLLLAAAALATVLAGCSADTVVNTTAAEDEVAAGLQAWRLATTQQTRADNKAQTLAALAAWRQATVERARTDRLAEIEKLRAQARIAGEQLRTAQAEEAIEQLRAQARVDGDAFRLGGASVSELADKQAIRAARAAQALSRLAEIEQLRAEAKAAGDQLRFQADTVVIWTEVGPVTVNVAEWADQVAAIGGADVVQTAIEICDRPRVVAFIAHDATLEAGQCPASNGLKSPPPPSDVIPSISIEQA